MLHIDILVAANVVTLVSVAIGGIVIFAKFYHWMKRTDEVMARDHKRINRLEETSEPLKVVDLCEWHEQMKTLNQNMENDYNRFKVVYRKIKIIMEGLIALFRHVEDGNNVRAIASSKNKLIDELLKTEEGDLI